MPQTPFLCDVHTAHLGGLTDELFSPPPPRREDSSSGFADSGSVGIAGGGARSARTVCSRSASAGSAPGAPSVPLGAAPSPTAAADFRGEETEGSFSFPAEGASPGGAGSRSPSGSEPPRAPRALRREGSAAGSGVDAADGLGLPFGGRPRPRLEGGSSSSLSSCESSSLSAASSLSSAFASAPAPTFGLASLDLECFRQKLLYSHPSLVMSERISMQCVPLSAAHSGWYAAEQFPKSHWMQLPVPFGFKHTSQRSVARSASMFSAPPTGSIVFKSLMNSSGIQLEQNRWHHRSRPPATGFSAPPFASHTKHVFVFFFSAFSKFGFPFSAFFPFLLTEPFSFELGFPFFAPPSQTRQNQSPLGTARTP